MATLLTIVLLESSTALQSTSTGSTAVVLTLTVGTVFLRRSLCSVQRCFTRAAAALALYISSQLYVLLQAVVVLYVAYSLRPRAVRMSRILVRRNTCLLQ